MKISLPVKLLYALGNAGLIALIATTSFFLLIFYTDVAHVPAGIAGSALLIGKIWDTLCDPIAGWLSDRHPSPLGRRRVFMIYGALPLAITATAIWYVPPGLSHWQVFLWIAVTYTLFDTFLTAVHTPFATLSAELTDDYRERTSLVAAGSFGALIGYILGSVALPKLLALHSSPSFAYLLGGGLFGAFAGLSVVLAAWGLREPQRPSTPPRGSLRDFFVSLRQPFSNPAFRILVSAGSLARLGLTLMQTSLVYYLLYQVEASKADIPRFMGILMLTIGVFIFVWKSLCNRWSKHVAYALGMTLTGISLALFVAFHLRESVPFYLAIGMMGVGLAAHWIAPYAMLPDAATAAENGADDNAGVYFGLYGLGEKIARTLGSTAVGWGLEWFDYQPNVAQSAHTLWGIDLMFGYIPAGLLILCGPLLLAYPLRKPQIVPKPQAA